MPNLLFLPMFFILLILMLAGYAVWDTTSRKLPFIIILFITIGSVFWFGVYALTPYRIEKTYEVKPEYNTNKTVQFITLEEPNKYMGDKIVTVYPIFNRMLTDKEVVIVHQKDVGTYWGIFPEPQTINHRNTFEVKP